MLEILVEEIASFLAMTHTYFCMRGESGRLRPTARAAVCSVGLRESPRHPIGFPMSQRSEDSFPGSHFFIVDVVSISRPRFALFLAIPKERSFHLH